MEHFIILTARGGDAPARLRDIFDPMGAVTVITDSLPSPSQQSHSSGCIWVPDEQAAEFGGILSRKFPRINAWSRAMCWLSKTETGDASVWFVEDDVAGDKASFHALIEGTVSLRPDIAGIELSTYKDDPSWPHWHEGADLFTDPCHGFMPLCRMSARLLKRVFEFQRAHGSCVFMEIMFASLARQHGMIWLDWSNDDHLKKHLGTFHYRPEVLRPLVGVSHPVKSNEVHKAICELTSTGDPLSEIEMMKDWLVESDAPARILETGTGAEVWLEYLMTRVFSHPESEAHRIDFNDESDASAAPGELVDRCAFSDRVYLYHGLTQEILAWMITNDGFWESFDCIGLNDARHPGDLMTDACQAWSLLKPGGLMRFANKLRRRPDMALSIKAFVEANHDRLVLMLDAELLVIRKKALR